MRSSVTTVADYLAALAEDRREAVTRVRRVIIDHLPEGYEEAMNWGMISYEVPLATYPDTYNGQPLMYTALASQKHHMAVYLTSVYSDDDAASAFKAAYLATGKRLDMGKSCVRFRSLDDLPLDLIGATIASTSVEEFIELVDRLRAG